MTSGESIIGSSPSESSGAITELLENNNLGESENQKNGGGCCGGKRDNSKEETWIKPVSVFRMYQYTTVKDKLLLFAGVLSALGASIGLPGINILFAAMEALMIKQGKEDFTKVRRSRNLTRAATGTGTGNGTGSSRVYTGLSNEAFMSKMLIYSLSMIGFGVLQLIFGYLMVFIFRRVALIQIYRIRTLYLRSLLRQNVGWYDTVQDSNFVSKISENLSKVEDATGDKVALFLYYSLTSLISVIVAFVYGWLLTLVVVSIFPAVLLTSFVMSSLQTKYSMDEQRKSGKAGKASEEALYNIRTVKVFSGQLKEMGHYERGLAQAKRAAKKRGVVTALGTGIMWFFNYGSYALAFWYGARLVFEGIHWGSSGPAPAGSNSNSKPAEYTPMNLLVVFYSVLVLLFHFVEALNLVETFSMGRAAAADVYSVIDRTPEIDSFSEAGDKPSERPVGKIEFRNIHFSYPSRPEVEVLHGLNLTINPGSTVALVGSSGCGKSTCLQLLQRFYDPTSGAILLDDEEIRELNITWYRSQLGVVSQEPVLFSTSIAENIRYGREGVEQAEIEEACRSANAHSFISKLPHKYETLVGDRGAQLSGGQKQRICIARALVRNPSVLILDEATSALDTRNESIVQHALDKVTEGRTTLIVAHRLSTIRTADLIVCIQNGQVMEIGKHAELLQKKGLYFQLITTQIGGNDSNFGVDDIASFEEVSREELGGPVINFRGDSLEIGDIIMSNPESRKSSQKQLSPDPDKEKEDAHTKSCTAFRILMLNKPECPLLIIGIIFSIIHGFSLPAYAFFFGDFMGVFSMTDRDKAQAQVDYYAVLFLLTGLVAGLTIVVASTCFSFAGENLTNRLRKLIFKKLLYQDVGWYDRSENSTGALCARLTGDTASIQGAAGNRLGTVVQSMTTITVATGISLAILPKLGLVATIFVPIIMVVAFVCDQVIQKQQSEEKEAFEESSKLAFQAVSNIRTVASLCKEKAFVEIYAETLMKPHKKALRNAHLNGLTYGLAELIVYCAYSAIYYYGGYLIVTENVEAEKILIIAEAMLWTMLMIGKGLAFGPSYNVGKVSGARILKFLESKEGMNPRNTPGAGSQLNSFQGNVRFENVEFRYPTRPEVAILKGMTESIESNSTVGICGPSGGGKSTCLLLLLKFYDPASGRILIDERDMADFNMDSYLSHTALVSQEPALFDRTIRNNIAYGDNARDIPMAEIISASKTANIHNFITTLPAGYETRVGDMGAQLSGGQKQRVAIARALVRNPKLLLLDEATSALDMESEKVVQDALDIASAGRTCISIAHRLSSIQHADKILVISHGVVAEGGTHTELLNNRGMYYTLWNMQSHGYSHQE